MKYEVLEFVDWAIGFLRFMLAPVAMAAVAWLFIYYPVRWIFS